MSNARNHIGTVGIFARTLITGVLIFGAYAQGKSSLGELGKPTSINGGATTTFKSGASAVEIKNEGYGHKMSDEGDHAFVEISLKSGADVGSLRFFTAKLPETQVWKTWSITVTKTADQGPPHDQKAPTDFVVTAAK